MPPFRLNRRTVLRGAGSVAIALPWLEVMAPAKPAQAAALPATRFVSVFTPGGTVLENWRPIGTETAFELSTILQPLEPVRDQVLIVDGVDMKSAVGEQNQAGIIAWLTGTPQVNAPNNFANGPSIDQVLAARLSQGRQLSSLELAVRWGTGKSHGVPSPINIANFADNATFDPIPPRLDPVTVWQELFGAIAPAPVTPQRAWDQSILDHVGRRYTALAKRLGAADRQRLEAHLTKIRELEQRLSELGSCAPPTLVDTSDYDPYSGLNSTDTGSIVDAQTDAAIPKVGKLMIDMLVMALACDLTAVATLQWSDTEAKHTFPWLGLNQHLHYYMNDGSYQPDECTVIFNWYAKQHAYLLEQMAQVVIDGESLLSQSVVFFGSNLQNPATHEKIDMPFLLAGNGGGLKTNRWLTYEHPSHNDLLVSILNLCGDNRPKFGDPLYCQGPLGRLT